MKNKQRNSWIQYGIMGAVFLVLYATGLHTEIIGFAQRGLLATGLMNPSRVELAQTATDENGEDIPAKEVTKADFNLQLSDAEGRIMSLADLKGKVIFMNLWATWCPPCIAEMPGIAKLHEELGDDVAFVMISLDQKFETAVAFKDRKEYSLPIYEPVNGLPSMYQSASLPTTYVIDARGNLVFEHKGMADYNTPEFRQFLKSLQ